MTLPGTWGQIAYPDTQVEPRRTPKLKDFVDISESIPDAANLNLTGKTLSQWRIPGLDVVHPQPKYYKEKDWRPLIKLLATIDRLTDLNYAVQNNFPSCLLQAIHQYHPTCRLNIWSTQNIALDVLDMGKVQMSRFPVFQDPFEFDLFRSPCLHAIKVYYAYGWGREHRSPIEHDAIIPFFTMAPNLKHLHVQRSMGMGTKIPTSNERLKDFMTTFGPPPTVPPRPVTFSCSPSPDGSDPLIVKWGQYFDFSYLQALDIERIQSVPEIVSLFSHLRKLERLFINLDRPISIVPGPRVCLQEADYKSIFGSINQLQYLRIRGLRNKSAIYSILEYHGESLRELIIEPSQSFEVAEYLQYHVYPVLAYDDILNFAKKAPGIRELRLTLERSKGDAPERLFYEALGAFPSLRILTLDLDYKSRRDGGPETNHPIETLREREDSSTNRARLEEAFINAAMDERLATEIWNLIYSKQNKEKLRKLRIVPYGWDLFPSKAERDILLHLSRSFLISKRGPDYGLETVEIGREEAQLQAERDTIVTREPNWVRSPPKRLQELIKSLWQLSESEMEDWTQHWRSFPLAT